MWKVCLKCVESVWEVSETCVEIVWGYVKNGWKVCRSVGGVWEVGGRELQGWWLWNECAIVCVNKHARPWWKYA